MNDEDNFRYYLVNCICYTAGFFIFLTCLNLEILQERRILKSLLVLLSFLVLMISKCFNMFFKFRKLQKKVMVRAISDEILTLFLISIHVLLDILYEQYKFFPLIVTMIPISGLFVRQMSVCACSNDQNACISFIELVIFEFYSVNVYISYVLAFSRLSYMFKS